MNTMHPATPASLREAVSRLNSLPAIPRLAQEILSLKLITEEGENSLLRLIEQDPLLSAKIVGLSNAPLFGASMRIMTVKDAVTVLGIKRIKMIALSFAMMSSMAQASSGKLNMQALWQHSLAVAMGMHAISRAMPRNLRPQDDEIFLAGLLHDIGFMVLNYLSPQLSDKFQMRLATEKDRTLEELEAEMLEMNHCELGAELGRHWNLPKAIVAVLRYHHQPGDARAAEGMPLVMMADVAEKLLPTFELACRLQPEVTEAEWQALGIEPGQVEGIVQAVRDYGKSASKAFT